MNRSKFVTGLIGVLVITAITTITRNYLEAGWSNRPDLQTHVENLKQLPEQIGDWVCSSTEDLPENARRILNCHGFINRSYWNAQTGATVTVAVLYGPRGPIAVHTPDVCYSGIGTTPVADRRSVEIKSDDRSDRFWTIQFTRGAEPTPSLEVWYAWSDGGPWVASEHPRFWLTDSLYKIQLAGPPGKNNTEGDCKSFLRALIPVLRQKLRSS
jgi:Protein of unknown function (DUF3485)